MAQSCVCGYERRDKSNWYHHIKSCKMRRVVEPLQQEVERLRAQQRDAAERADQERDAALRALELKYSQLAEKVDKIEAAQQALVPAKQTTINNTVNNTININIYPFEETPLPKKQEVLALLQSPARALPSYFYRKHLANPKTCNLKLVGDDKMSVYSKDRTGVRKWTTRDRKPMLTKIVERLIDDLTKAFESPRDEGWKNWRRYCSDTGLNWSHPETLEEFQDAERQIEMQLENAAE